jgi:hypothetical protein
MVYHKLFRSRYSPRIGNLSDHEAIHLHNILHVLRALRQRPGRVKGHRTTMTPDQRSALQKLYRRIDWPPRAASMAPAPVDFLLARLGERLGERLGPDVLGSLHTGSIPAQAVHPILAD